MGNGVESARDKISEGGNFSNFVVSTRASPCDFPPSLIDNNLFSIANLKQKTYAININCFLHFPLPGFFSSSAVSFNGEECV
jgi:hypothetical protein